MLRIVGSCRRRRVLCMASNYREDLYGVSQLRKLWWERRSRELYGPRGIWAGDDLMELVGMDWC